MGWFTNNIEPIDQNILDDATICDFKMLTIAHDHCISKLENEKLTSVEKLIVEANKQRAINKAVELLDSLSHKEIIAVNEDLDTVYIKRNEKFLNIDGLISHSILSNK